MKKIVKVMASLLAVCLFVTGCGNNAELKDKYWGLVRERINRLNKA